MPRTKTVSDESILEEFRSADDAFLTAAELSRELGLTRQAINYRLKDLEAEGLLQKKRAGSHAVGWWIVEDHSD